MLVEMELRQIVRDMKQAAFVLGEKEGRQREFPIFTDLFQARILEMTVAHQEMDRPLTHDLALNIVEGLGAKVRRAIIHTSDETGNEDVYFAKLDLEQRDHSSVWIDSRSTDAIVIATKVSAPIYIDSELLDRVGRNDDGNPPPPPQSDPE
jgi:uncharacterized protein